MRLSPIVVLPLQLGASILVAQPGPPMPPSEDAQRCAALARLWFQSVREAPTTITGARLVDVTAPPNASPQGAVGILAASPIKQYCQVSGYVAPQNKFELRLPLPAQWNEKFFMTPCAGFCGGVNGSACNPSLARGYASVTMNGGHDSNPPFDGTWAANAPNLQEDFAWRSAHVVTLAAKEVTTHYYGRAIKRAYISGCSKGGQTVLSEVQRFPDDYDGAIPGAPVYNWTGQMIGSAWWAQVVNDGNGNTLLDSAAATNVHKSVLARCGAQAGVAEPFVSDPLSCDWTPQLIACTGDRTMDCLSTKQVAAIAKLMRPVTTSSGRVLYPGHLPGIETEWRPWFSAPDGSRSITDVGDYLVSRQFASYLADATVHETDPLTLTVDELTTRFARASSVYNATNPDLHAFKARGGKVLLWHGLADGGVPARASIDYYANVVKTMGGNAKSDDFIRLLLLPGVHHCGGGPGPDNIDLISAIESWVEKGIAPNELVARRYANGVEARSRSGVSVSGGCPLLGNWRSNEGRQLRVGPSIAWKAAPPMPRANRETP